MKVLLNIEMFIANTAQKTKHYGWECFHVRPGHDSGTLFDPACFSFISQVDSPPSRSHARVSMNSGSYNRFTGIRLGY